MTPRTRLLEAWRSGRGLTALSAFLLLFGAPLPGAARADPGVRSLAVVSAGAARKD